MMVIKSPPMTAHAANCLWRSGTAKEKRAIFISRRHDLTLGALYSLPHKKQRPVRLVSLEAKHVGHQIILFVAIQIEP